MRSLTYGTYCKRSLMELTEPVTVTTNAQLTVLPIKVNIDYSHKMLLDVN